MAVARNTGNLRIVCRRVAAVVCARRAAARRRVLRRNIEAIDPP
jgi:hypothetical protein